MNQHVSPGDTATGLALILLPLLGVWFKIISAGWLMVLVFFGPIFLLLAGYAVQILISVQGFFRKPGLFNPATKRRVAAAAWLTTIAFLLFTIFVVDGGDGPQASTFQIWYGAVHGGISEIRDATRGFSDGVSLIALFLWLPSFLWLLVEWTVAVVRRRREAG